MPVTTATIQLLSSHASFEPLVDHTLDKAGIHRSAQFGRGVAKVILDFPLTWAFAQLELLNSFERARTVVCTQSGNKAYLDCLGSYHLSAVVEATDEKSLLSAVYAASDAQRIYQYQSGLTYMELRVTGSWPANCISHIRRSTRMFPTFWANSATKAGHSIWPRCWATK